MLKEEAADQKDQKFINLYVFKKEKKIFWDPSVLIMQIQNSY